MIQLLTSSMKTNFLWYYAVSISWNEVEIKEVFLNFFQLEKKDASSIAIKVLSLLEQYGLPIEDCHRQSYDNAAVMTGARNGVQKKILDVNPRAMFVNCENQNLNLACLHSCAVNPCVTTFFGVLDRLFASFSVSSSRWAILK